MRLNEDFFNDNHLDLNVLDNQEPAIDKSIVQWQAGRALIDILSDYNLWIDISVDMRSFKIRSNRYEEELKKIRKIIYKKFEKIMNVLEVFPYDVQISPCVLGYTESEYSYRKIAENHYETYNDYKMYQTENTENGEYLRAYIGLKCSGEVNYLKAYYIINRIQNILFQSELVYSITLLWKNKDSERIEDVLLLQQKHIEDMLIESIYNLIMEYSDEYMETLRDMFAALYGLSKNDAKKTGLDYLKKIFMDYMDKRGITYK